ncbi:MAG: hypothetical protein F9K41_11055 [Sphingopyxis terrae]|nr:MAG: hypothetical protein F9K41_11055 [Sphingopyxis terrae]
MSLLKVATALAGSFVVFTAPTQAQEAAEPPIEATQCTDASAQGDIAPVAAPAIAAPAPSLLLPAYSEVILTPDTEASSKKLREGDVVPMHSMFDVMHNGVVVIPKGSRANGMVTWRTGKGAFGKSAKMEIGFKELIMLGGQKVALSGSHRQEGQGNTGAAVGAAVAVGVFGAFVTGKSAIIPVGQQLTARTADPLPYVIPAGAKIVPTAELAPVVPATAPAPAADTVAETADTQTS